MILVSILPNVALLKQFLQFFWCQMHLKSFQYFNNHFMSFNNIFSSKILWFCYSISSSYSKHISSCFQLPFWLILSLLSVFFNFMMPKAPKIFLILLIIILRVQITIFHQKSCEYIATKSDHIVSKISTTLSTNHEKLSSKHTKVTI